VKISYEQMKIVQPVGKSLNGLVATYRNLKIEGGSIMATGHSRYCRIVTIAMTALTFGLSSTTIAAPVVISGSGDITGVVNQCRTALGNPNNGATVGEQPSGRREINWDGVPNSFSAPNNLPADFFNVNSPRGVVFSTPGSGVQVSANAGVAPIEFDNINATYSAQFNTFSPQRLFTALGSNITDVNFFVAGLATPATVTGFGAVFSDIDVPNSASIQFFAGGASLGTFFAPVRTDSTGLSFLCVTFNAGERASRVQITSGQGALGAGVNDISDGGTLDLVVMDDFLYSEPKDLPPSAGPPVAIPTLTGWAMIGLTLLLAAALAFGLRRRGRLAS